MLEIITPDTEVAKNPSIKNLDDEGRESLGFLTYAEVAECNRESVKKRYNRNVYINKVNKAIKESGYKPKDTLFMIHFLFSHSERQGVECEIHTRVFLLYIAGEIVIDVPLKTFQDVVMPKLNRIE